jgi:mRNA interferase HigB
LKVVGRERLEKFAAKHADARPQIDAWLCEVEEASWRTTNDIKARFPSASLLPGNRVMFNLKGNKYRLDTKVGYESQIVLVMRIGTHAEYSKWSF